MLRSKRRHRKKRFSPAKPVTGSSAIKRIDQECLTADESSLSASKAMAYLKAIQKNIAITIVRFTA